MTGRRCANDHRQHLKKTVSMTENDAERVRASVNAVYHTESRRILATLIRLLGDFDLAEDALHDAFTAALQQWPRDGMPANPRSWLISAGRFKAIDAIRRRARFDSLLGELAEQLDADARAAAGRSLGRGDPSGAPARRAAP